MQGLRTLFAFLVAPLVVPSAVAIWLVGTGESWNAGSSLIVGLFAIVGYVGTIGLGLPLYLRMLASGATAFPYAPAVGGSMGVMFWAFFFAYQIPGAADGSVQAYALLASCVGVGAGIAIVLWLIARPDLR